MTDKGDFEYLFGINSLETLLEVNAGRRKIYDILLDNGKPRGIRLNNILNLAGKKGISIRELSSENFNKIAKKESSSQGICARVSHYNYTDLEDYLNLKTVEDSRLLILDGVTDAGNFGAIIRNCRAFGFNGILIPRKRNVQVNCRISRISAGALEGVRIFGIGNIIQNIRWLKENGFWIYGTTLERSEGVRDLDKVQFIFPLCLVLGSEDRGMGRLVGENCDVLVTIRLSGRMQSLNVSMASAIFMYEIQKQAGKQ